MIALLAALGVAALVSLQPWAKDSVGPQVSVAPDLGAALGDAVAVSPSPRLAVATARPAAGKPSFVADEVATGAGASHWRPGIAPARAVAPAAGPPAEGSPQPPTVPLPPEPQATPAPAATPVSNPAPPSSPAPVAAIPARPAPGTGHPGPVTAGGPGPVGGVVSGPVLVRAGDEYAYSFSFYIQPSVYLPPGEDNLIVQLGDEAGDSHSFGLQLWDDGSGTQRGLWASGDAVDGERFLAPVAEGAWHQVVLYFQASSEDDGLYLLLLDGEPIDARAWVSLVDSASGYALLDSGLFRDGERVDGAPDVFFGPARLGETLEAVIS